MGKTKFNKKSSKGQLNGQKDPATEQSPKIAKPAKKISKPAEAKKQKKPVLSQENDISDIAKIKAAIEEKLQSGKIKKEHAQINEQREPIERVIESSKHPRKITQEEWIKTGIPGFDDLLEKGIPKG